jgi:hypothetical protein
MATTKTLLPPPYQTVEDLNGFAVAGATVTFLDTGTAVLSVVYADADGLVISPNPLTVDAAGRFTVFLTPGQVVDVQYRDAAGALIKTVPGVSAVPAASGNVDTGGTFGETVSIGQLVYLSDGTGGKTAGQWFLASQQQNQGLHSVVGISLSAGAAASGGTIRTEGRVTGLSGLVVGARYFVSATPGALVLQSGFSGGGGYRLVGQADSTTSLVLTPNPLNWQSYVDLLTPPSVPTPLFYIGVAQTVLLTPVGGNVTMQGIKAGYHGQRLRVVHRGAAGTQINLVHSSPSAATADRLFNWVTSAPTSLVPTGVADYEYDVNGPYWKLVAHEQGGWIAPPFFASDYVGAGGATWTVTAGAVAANRYYLRGTMLSCFFYLGSTTIGGAGTQLQIRVPGGYTSPVTWAGATRPAQFYDAGGQVEALAGVIGNVIALQKNSNAIFAAGASPVLFLSISFEVT